MTGTIQDAGGVFTINSWEFAAPLQNLPKLISALYNRPFSTRWFVVTFDSIPRYRPGRAGIRLGGWVLRTAGTLPGRSWELLTGPSFPARAPEPTGARALVRRRLLLNRGP